MPWLCPAGAQGSRRTHTRGPQPTLGEFVLFTYLQVDFPFFILLRCALWATPVNFMSRRRKEGHRPEFAWTLSAVLRVLCGCNWCTQAHLVFVCGGVRASSHAQKELHVKAEHTAARDRGRALSSATRDIPPHAINARAALRASKLKQVAAEFSNGALLGTCRVAWEICGCGAASVPPALDCAECTPALKKKKKKKKVARCIFGLVQSREAAGRMR